MMALVSRTKRRLLLSASRPASPGPLYLRGAGALVPQVLQVSVYFLPGPAVKAAEAAGVVPDPVPGPAAQDYAVSVPAYGQAVSGPQAHVPQHVGREGYLVFAAYGGHGRPLLSSGIYSSSLPYFTTPSFPLQVLYALVG